MPALKDLITQEWMICADRWLNLAAHMSKSVPHWQVLTPVKEGL